MKVLLKIRVSNQDYRGRPGQIIDLPEPEALRLITLGQAQAVESVLETASIAPTHSAMRPRGRPRKVS